MDSVGNIILYFVVAIAVVVFSMMAVSTRRILRSATYLLFVLIGTAVFYFQLGYEFLGAVQIAVYAGGIMVLFVFAIILTSKPGDKTPLLSSHRRFVGAAASLLGVVVLAWALINMPVYQSMSLSEMISDGAPVDMKSIGHMLLSGEKFGYLLPFEAVSVLLLACIIGGVVVARKR